MAESLIRVLKFHGGAAPADAFVVLSADGHEEISRPFRFEIELVSQKTDIDLGAMLEQAAWLGIKQGVKLKGSSKRGVQTLKIHGVLSSIEQLERGLDWVRYRVVLVPKLWRLSLGTQSQIHMDMSVPEIVEKELKRAGFAGNEFEFRTTGRTYPKREYVVQYLESDLDFISRLCEHEGIFYYFEHGEDSAKIIFGDSPAACGPIQGSEVLAYRPASTSRTRVEAADDRPEGDWFQEEVVHSLSTVMRPVPEKTVLCDYNYRNPADDLKVESPVATGAAFNTFYEYGDHYKDKGQGEVYARIRAEEFKCRQTIFAGTSDSKSLRCGSMYTLSEHYRGDLNRKYLITKVLHHATQPVEFASAEDTVPRYSNEFATIAADVVFRPERKTPKPRVSGLLNATIDAGGSGQYAEIDEEGRYKVVIPFDLSGRSGGKATRYIRMAQPYAGGGMGMHFPLHKGTEVILAHVNGDPDRPIIVAAVPNPQTASPVQGSNQTQCVIHTGGGNKIVIEDSAGGERIALSSPHGESFFSIGAPPE
jgi:type VI secretion system secreted protein VgrG